MNCFPPLHTGAAAQFPLRRRTRTRTIRNRLPDGREIKLPDPAAAAFEWDLVFQELTDAEADSLLQFFAAMEGPLQSFTFLDPAGNLLQWSEQFDQPAWQADPLLQLSSGVPDPQGGTAAYRVVNPAGAGLRLRQTLNAPAFYTYAFSVWARADAPGPIFLHRGDLVAGCAVGPAWRRLVFGAASTALDTTVTFAIELLAGASCDLFGAQVEAQPGASGYKMTTALGGVWPNTAFTDPTLAFTTAGPGRHGCTIHLRTN